MLQLLVASHRGGRGRGRGGGRVKEDKEWILVTKLGSLVKDSKIKSLEPIFKDVNTPSPFREDLAAYGDDGSSAAAAKDDHIYLDAMGFGMGLCCLQLTFQVRPHRHYSGDT